MKLAEITQLITSGIKDVLSREFGFTLENLQIGFPPNIRLGNFVVETFHFAKAIQHHPKDIAAKIANKFQVDGKIVARIEAAGPYLNISLTNTALFAISAEIIKAGKEFGNAESHNTNVMVEYLSPNTNKPLHLGHIRNGCLGMAIANILEATGHNVIKANLINDRGVHICKSMLAWQNWGNGTTPESTGIKGDHFVGQWYVTYARKSEHNINLEEQVQEMLQRWESGHPETLELWNTMNKWVYAGFEETYKKIGFEFDVFYYESNTYKLGKDIVAEGLNKKVFVQDARGTVIFHLPEEDFGLDQNSEPRKVTVLRHDGTSVYITQDIGTALLKVTDHNLHQSIYVVGSEQIHHFKCLFRILRDLGFDWAKECHHLSYGMVYLPEGKMKSREGKVVDADDLIDEMKKLAAEEIQKRQGTHELSEKEIFSRAGKIALAAIKFYFLRVNPSQDIHFDPRESISFDGFTGPYCQYAYARISGILRNAKEQGVDIASTECDFSILGNEEETMLMQKLIQFPETLRIATRELSPLKVAVYVYETSKAFNQFYNKHQVLYASTKELKGARLVLIQAAATVLKNGLNLLGIETLDDM